MKQTELILVYLARHGSITQGEAYMMGIGRLAARISDLKKQGHPIDSKIITVTKADGTTAKVAAYSLGR